ncbi:DUF4191 domain-containing protein [Pseudoscardovia radai]|uniref:DUF4191 domain-containing protein n=1 Tax=Pseudoscardovia radai TaxID=987066 RepID=UPI0039910725
MATDDSKTRNSKTNDGKDGTDGKKRGRIRETFTQIGRVYRYTRRVDSKLPWVMALSFGIPVLISVLLPLFLYRRSIVGWILTVLTGVMIGFTVAVWVLTNRSNTAVYSEMEGKPGATAMVLSNLNNKAYTFYDQPIWVDPRTKDMVLIGTSLSGIFLVGEGDYGRVQRAMDAQTKKIKRITQGSAIPIYRICVGTGPKQVPLKDLRKSIVRGHKMKLRQDELTNLNNRISTLQKRNNTMNMPQGIDPSRVHISPRALRGR